jgi:hypothetical protein
MAASVPEIKNKEKKSAASRGIKYMKSQIYTVQQGIMITA